jgi:hypothetical protein
VSAIPLDNIIWIEGHLGNPANNKGVKKIQGKSEKIAKIEEEKREHFGS